MKVGNSYFYYTDLQIKIKKNLIVKSSTPAGHTFSRICERYGVREADRKRILGHSFGNDITNGVYGHRTLEELRTEIEKIKVPEFPQSPS